MDLAPAQSDLFETPPGVRVIPAEVVLCDPDRTVVMEYGDLEESEQLLRGFDPEASIRHTRTGFGSGVGGEAWTTASLARTLPIRRTSHLRHRNTAARPGKFWRFGFGPGTRFVTGLLLLTTSLGAAGLALSWQSRDALIVAGFFSVATGVLFWVFWRSWLDGFPYVYRLMTSLGEDAENLVRWRMWRAFGGTVRSLYR
jgi:hypothetical protein